MANRSEKVLFQAKTLNNAIAQFTFPSDLEARQQKVLDWSAALTAGTLDEVKEVSLHGEFLRDIFQDILGYTSVIQGKGKTWEIHAEQTISEGGGSADGALGLFTATDTQQGSVKLQGRVVAPIELKGARTNLDRRKPGSTESPVEQGWRYANYTPNCKWLIVSNYRETRLYQTSKTPAYYEEFLLTDLADLNRFKRFYYLLCRQNFLPKTADATATSVIDRLLIESAQQEQAITDELYQLYAETRRRLVNHFLFTAPADIPNRELVMIEKAQKTLDRILFMAFCEDRGLLPDRTITDAHDFKDPYLDPYRTFPRWDRYKVLFRWVDRGNDDPPIPGYDGGLFRHDPILDDQLTIPDPRCGDLNQLTKFDFSTEVSVDILGRIFEQSITDLEELRAEKTGQDFDKTTGKRKRQGIFYTPAWITQYIVTASIGTYLKRQEQHLQTQGYEGAAFWRQYLEVLKTIRVVDPACGSGAFLIAAFEYLFADYQRVNGELVACGEDPISLEDVDRTILTQNLYGVDLSMESVEITKLSLWLETAVPGKVLTDLDDTIKVGNSLITDANVDSRAFDWAATFPHVFEQGGFDIAIGNPPYVRQELFSSIKPYLQQHYATYHGVADLYTYFYEKGLNLLKPEGLLSYIVTNKWLRAGYGEPLRQFFTETSVFEQIIDFGHAPIFQDADTFPCIIVARKLALPKSEDSAHTDPPRFPRSRTTSLEKEGTSDGSAPPVSREIGREYEASENPESPSSEETKDDQGTSENLSPPVSEATREDHPVIICPVPRDQLKEINLVQYIDQESYIIPWPRFTAAAWSLETPAVDVLMEKMQQAGISLQEFSGITPCYGIKTGFNKAFLIDEATKNQLVQADPKSAEILKPYLRGQDVKRWSPEWQNLWIILLKSSSDYSWIWSDQGNNAERTFAKIFPVIYKYLKPLEDALKKRRDQGKYWWELRSCAYYQSFEQPKIIYQVIQTLPQYSFDNSGAFGNDKTFILPTSDFYLLGLLNSPLIWWYSHRVFTKMLSGAISPMGYLMEILPIAPPTDEIRDQVEPAVSRLIEITQANQSGTRDVLDWLRSTYSIDKPGQKLEDFASLSFEEFVAEVRHRFPKNGRKGSDPLGVAGFKAVRAAYNDYAPVIQTRRAEALQLEHRLSALVNQAYGLTAEDVDLMWRTAPPRMPIQPVQQ